MIAGGGSQAEQVAVLRKAGYRTLLDDAAAKVLGGLTSLEDVLEVVAES